jgi:hypothetical protein
MSSDWMEQLTPDERADWDALVEHFRRSTLEGITRSAAYLSFAPPPDQPLDLRFCMELGAAVMLDKPLITVTAPGQKIPANLRRLAVEIIEADIDLEEGQREVAAALARLRDGISDFVGNNAHTDSELNGWLLTVVNGDPARGVAPAGDFLRTLAQAALRADPSNYALLRPALLELRAKYPR